MAISYSSKMGQIGKLIKYVNSFTTLAATTLPADLADIMGQYGTANTGTTNSQDQIEGIAGAFQGLMNGVASMRVTIAGYANTTLTDYDTVVSQLSGASSADVGTVLPLLYQDMLDNAQTVVRSTVTLGAVSALATTVGTGTVLFDAQLDGYNPPVSGGAANPRYAGVQSELAPPTALHALACTADSYAGGVTPGEEVFSWNDGVNFGPFSPYPEGAGAGPGVTAAQGASVTPDGTFANWVAGAPSGWTLTTGTGAGSVAQDTTNVFGANTSSLQFVGNAARANPGVSTPLAAGLVNPLRRYCVPFYAQRTAGSGASGVLSVALTGTGYLAPAGASFSLAVSGLAASWTLYSFFVTLPAVLPSDLALQVGISGTLDAASKVNVSNAFFAPVTYFAGVNCLPVGGAVPFVQGDRFSATHANNGAGLFQEFFRQMYQVQLPSAPASPTTGAFALLPPYTLFTGGGASAATIPNSYAT